MSKACVLYDRECIECGDCERCDLDPNKICDNCMKCVMGNASYRAIAVDGFKLQQEMTQKESPVPVQPEDDGLDWDALMSGFDA